MGLLGDFTAYIDNLKRRGMNTAKDLASDPMGLLGRNVSALSESLPAAPGEPQNEMLARPGMQDWATGVALNAPTMGLLGHTVYRGGPNEFDKLMPRMLDLDKPLSQQSKTIRALAVPPAHRDAYKLGLNHAKQNAVYDDMPMLELERFNRMSDAESAFYEAGARRLPPPLISDGYRFGKAPDGRSTNFADNVPEKGVSMASVTDPRFDDSWEKTISSMFIKPGRKKYTYQGFVLPPAMSGADGEPLMVGLRAPETGLEFYQRLQKLYGGEDGAAKTLRERGLLGVRRAAGDGAYDYVVFE